MTLFLAMFVDAILGEPKRIWDRIPHPAVLMGKCVDWADTNFNTGTNLKAKGALSLAGLCIGAILMGIILKAFPTQIIDIIVLAILLAQRSLHDHVIDVMRSLKLGLPQGRTAVAKIVGRDTKDMSESDVARAAIESAAENLSDGVIAPIFWFIFAGLPGLLLYKIVNTADSMIGHRTPRHAQFGWAAARLDDVLNFIPARLTAVLIAAASLRFDALGDVFDEAPSHRSPNAGWPEAAMAYVLNIALSGPRSYGGDLQDYPYMNENGIRELGPQHIEECLRILWIVWAIVLAVALIFGLIF